MKNINTDTSELFKRLYNETKSCKQIAEITGIKEYTIYKHLNETYPEILRRPLKTSQDTLNKIPNLYIQHRSIVKIGLILNISRSVVYKYMIENHLDIYNLYSNRNQRLYTIDVNFFDKIDTSNKAYILGFLYADGYVNEKKYIIQVGLNKKDTSVLEFIQRELNTITPIREQKNGNVLYLNSKQLVKSLVKLGCHQAKTFTLKFPTEDQVPKYLLSHFIRGYIDGDGCIYNHKRKRTTSIHVTGNNYFITELNSQLINILKLESGKLKELPKSLGISVLSFYKRKTVTLLKNYLYKDASFFLERKYEKFLTYDH